MRNLYNWIFDQELDLNKKIISTQNVDYTYKDILNEIEKYSTLLGDVKNKKVALIVSSIPSFIALVLTVSKLGGISIPLSPLLRKDDLQDVLDFTDPHFVFTGEIHNGFPLSETVHRWAKESQRETIVYDSKDYGEWKKTTYKGEERPLEFENIELIGCTSGSTGTPKGVKVDFEYVRTADEGFLVVNEISIEVDHLFLMAPSTGIFGLCWLLSGLHSQYHIVTTESFSFPEIIQLLEKKPCQKLISTPSLVRALNLFAKTSRSKALDDLTLITIAGEMITEDFLKAVEEYPCKIRSYYGFSELGGMMYTEKDIREGIIWSPLPIIQYSIDQKPGEEIGEILFRSSANPFLGYYKQPELTEEVLTDSWYHSGDLARHNEEGKIEIVGRKKDMIKKGGQQVIPGEIEQFLMGHPSVDKAVVVGKPHSVYGEEIVAFIVKDKEVEKKELFEYCDRRIARYKVPDQIHFIEEFPMNNGKVDKVSLRILAQ